jgi:gas vesicle protein
MKVPKFVSPFALGFFFGAGLALLLAPMTGKKMQRKVGDIADKVADKVEDLRIAAQRIAS